MRIRRRRCRQHAARPLAIAIAHTSTAKTAVPASVWSGGEAGSGEGGGGGEGIGESSGGGRGSGGEGGGGGGAGCGGSGEGGGGEGDAGGQSVIGFQASPASREATITSEPASKYGPCVTPSKATPAMKSTHSCISFDATPSIGTMKLLTIG